MAKTSRHQRIILSQRRSRRVFSAHPGSDMTELMTYGWNYQDNLHGTLYVFENPNDILTMINAGAPLNEDKSSSRRLTWAPMVPTTNAEEPPVKRLQPSKLSMCDDSGRIAQTRALDVPASSPWNCR